MDCEVVEYTGTTVQDFLDFNNKLDEDLLIKMSQLNESHKDELESYIDFVTRNKITPKVGQLYFYGLFTYIPSLSSLTISLFDKKRKLVKVDNNQYSFDFNGTIKTFPEQHDFGWIS